jgi:hypothetical protein
MYMFQFFQFNVVVSYQKVTETESMFPSVTICNINSLDITENQATGQCLIKIFEVNNLAPFVTVNDSQDAIAVVDDYANIIKASLIAGLKKRGSNDIFRLGFTLDKLVISCYYNEVKCELSEFFMFYDFQYGNCYTFNSPIFTNGSENPNPKVSTQPGIRNGKL